MSYLHTPRIVFTGSFRASAATKNNLLAALDDQTIMNSGDLPGAWDWSPQGRGNFTLVDCQIRSAWSAEGRFLTKSADDPIIGSAVVGTAKMADLDPQHRRLTDLIGMNLVIGLPTPSTDPRLSNSGVSGILNTCQMRDYWTSATVKNSSASWQSVLMQLLWSGAYTTSPILAALNRTSPAGLSVRISPIVNGLDQATGTLYGSVFGAIGPFEASEPEQFIAARRLISRSLTGPANYPVASTLVDERRKTLVVDLGNLPLGIDQKNDTERINGLVATILRDQSAGGGVEDVIPPRRNIDTGTWLQTAGIVEWELSDRQIELLRSRRLQLTFEAVSLLPGTQPSLTLGKRKSLPQPPKLATNDPPLIEKLLLVLEEHASGKYADVDRHSMRLNPGESQTFRVYARRWGRPLAGEVLKFFLYQQPAIAAVESILLAPTDPGYPIDPNLPINSEPRDVILGGSAPLQVTTDQNGFAELQVQIHPGSINLPDYRKTVDSQVYFLGDPDGWQTWGAFGPNSDDQVIAHRPGSGCALGILVFNTHPQLEKVEWADVQPLLERYSTVFPVMLTPTTRLDLSKEYHVRRYAAELTNRLNLPFENVGHMPVTRDLSTYHRQMIVRYLADMIMQDTPRKAPADATPTPPH